MCSNYTLERTWIATDDCGNTVIETQTISVGDFEDPIIANVPADISAECSNIPNAPTNITATDNCDTNVELTMNEETFTGDCPGNYSLVRTWTATDDCGNTAEASQTIVVQDTEAPVLVGIPADETGDCNNIPNIPPLGTITATDNCDTNVEITFDELIVDNACGQTITRTWTATDDCGNSIDATQTITVGDTEAPILVDMPSDITVECDDIPTSVDPQVQDDCDSDINVLFSDIITPGDCENQYIITRTWTATDDCGNSTSAEQIVTVEDNTPPTLIGVPSDLNADCNDIPTIPPAGTVTATDTCDDDVQVTFEENTEDNACGQTITRTWTATDNCGNETSGSQIITVGDQSAPEIVGVPADISAECSDIPDVPSNITINDDCDSDIDLIFNEETFAGDCPGNYSLIRTWSATDDCGNTTEETQTIIVQDTEAPVLVGIPADVVGDCNNIPNVPSTGTITATDNCDINVEITFDESIVDNDCGQTITRTWTATDDCGNETSESQIITVGDNEEPTLANVPADITISCEELGNIQNPNVTTTDNCDTDITAEMTETTQAGSCEHSYQITRTWTATDDCGNVTTDEQIITIEDTTLPVLVGIPADENAACGDIPNIPPAGSVTATDNCDTDVQIDFSETTEDGLCENSYKLIRTWIATDDCGNTVIATQEITVGDTEQPVLAGVPSDENYECGDNIHNGCECDRNR